jgi:ribonuclease-3
MSPDLKSFFQRISYQFTNLNLVEEALTHPSLSKDNPHKPNYQRLEFLGDKVLGLVVGEYLMKNYPKEMEGYLSRRQASLVSGENLAEIALKIGLEQVLKVSSGEKKLGGKLNKRNLENSLEALIGAIYLDSNYFEAKNFIMKFWQHSFERDIAPPKDPVSELQEYVQIRTKQLPIYDTVKDGGLDHAPNFISTVKLPINDLQFSASGKSKKEAQKAVAKLALNHLV